VERFLKAQSVALPAGPPAAATGQSSGTGLGGLTARHGRSVAGVTCG
jgi:hypothetical protein